MIQRSDPAPTPLFDEARAELEALSQANLAHARRYPGEPAERQPVHTVYGGAHLFKATTCARLGELALASLEAHAPDAISFARALGVTGHEALPTDLEAGRRLMERFAREPEALRAERFELWLPLAVHARVLAKLRREAVEDYRIDFEDGFGVRSEAEHDEAAIRAAKETAIAMRAGSLPPFFGIRIGALDEDGKARAVRTLELYLSTLVAEAGALPGTFLITLPKVSIPEQPRALARLLALLERRLGVAEGSLRMELMIELNSAIVAHDGTLQVGKLVSAAEGRCHGVHFGTYDYTASCDVTAAWQSMDHPLSRFALMVMKSALSGTGVRFSDGATHVMPVPPHRGASLTEAQQRENVDAVHAAWRLAYRNVRGSLQHGYYQGWDLHPAQLVARYAAFHAFFLEGADAASARLSSFLQKAAQASLVGTVFDDAASAQGLLNYFLRGLASGAVTEDELASTGLTLDELRLRSFPKILAARAARRDGETR